MNVTTKKGIQNGPLMDCVDPDPFPEKIDVDLKMSKLSY
jgi:hypothetical protein